MPHHPGNAHLLLPLESNFVFGDGCLLRFNMVKKKTSTHQKNPEDNSLKAVGVLAQNPGILNRNPIFSSRRNNLVACYNSAISKPQQIYSDDLWKSCLNILSGLPISPDRDTRDHISFAGGRLGRPGCVCVRVQRTEERIHGRTGELAG